MIETPQIMVYVPSQYLGYKDQNQLKKAYLMAVDSRTSMALSFTVYLETGAIWSGLPIEAIRMDKYNKINLKVQFSNDLLQPFSCLSDDASIIEYSLLKNAKVSCKGLGPGHYLFTISYRNKGLAEDPEQNKTHNIICLDNGQLAALPNNNLIVKDNWFSDENQKEELKNYKRNSKHYFPGG